MGNALRLLIVLVLVQQGSTAAVSTPFEYAQVHMGMEVRMRLFASTAHAAESAATAAFARISALDRMMSDYRPDSELRRLQGNGNAWTPVSAELFDVLQRSVAIARETEGAFDPTIGRLVRLWREARSNGRLPEPSAIQAAKADVGWRHISIDVSRRAVRTPGGLQLDLGGIAKGYILQEALRELRTRGIHSALIEAGGDIVVSNAPPGRAGWRVEAPGASAAFIERANNLTNAALSTSGPSAQYLEVDGVRYSHVIDPRTGFGLTNNLTARVIAPDAATADALSTALTVAGPDRWHTILARFPNVQASVDRVQ
jgi:thiamine biosynthesis lipoprotein